MTRDLDRLTGRTFDVLVVGGGIYGLTIAYDAAQRGLAVALVERDDFGSGASFNHLRTIHGGLRYLQSLDLRRARESVHERRTVARVAPQAVRPMPFAVPLYRSVLRGKTAMRAGFAVDRLVSAGRNRGVPPSHRLPGGRVVGRGSAIQRFPGLKRRGLTGAAIFHDYVMTEPDRFTFAYALGAAQHEAILVNHLEAIAPLADAAGAKRVVGVTARDGLSGRTIEIAARVTVNATGAAVDRLLKPIGTSTGIAMTKVMNLVTRRDAGEEALGGRSSSGRNLFLVPWRDRALFGTWEAGRVCDPDDTTVDERDVLAFISDLNQAYPALDLTLGDVTLVHRGIVPAAVHGDQAAPDGHDQVRDHAAQGIEGIVSVAGAKFTTARAVAARVTDALLQKLQHEPVPCRTATTPLPGGSVRDVGLAIADARREFDEGLPTDTIPHLIAAYGSRFRDVMDIAAPRPDWRRRVAPDSPVIGAELVLAARKEMAPTLADVVIRRTPLGALGYPGDVPLERAAAIVGAELGWSEERRRDQIAAVQRFYSSAKASAERTALA